VLAGWRVDGSPVCGQFFGRGGDQDLFIGTPLSQNPHEQAIAWRPFARRSPAHADPPHGAAGQTAWVNKIMGDSYFVDHPNRVVLDRELKGLKIRRQIIKPLHRSVRKRFADHSPQKKRGIACLSWKAMKEQVVGGQLIQRMVDSCGRPEAFSGTGLILVKK
jgi:hypothetical protein